MLAIGLEWSKLRLEYLQLRGRELQVYVMEYVLEATPCIFVDLLEYMVSSVDPSVRYLPLEVDVAEEREEEGDGAVSLNTPPPVIRPKTESAEKETRRGLL